MLYAAAIRLAEKTDRSQTSKRLTINIYAVHYQRYNQKERLSCGKETDMHSRE